MPATPSGPSDRSRSESRLHVAGVGGGVGTTTVAVALGATDRGVFTGRPAQILVCRATVESLVRAGRAAQLLTTGAGPPVLAVNCVDQARRSKAVLDRLRLLEPNTRATVLLPHVPTWSDHPFPLDAVRVALRIPPGDLPRLTRRYVDAVRQLGSVAGAASVPNPRPASPPQPETASSATNRKGLHP